MIIFLIFISALTSSPLHSPKKESGKPVFQLSCNKFSGISIEKKKITLLLKGKVVAFGKLNRIPKMKGSSCTFHKKTSILHFKTGALEWIFIKKGKLLNRSGVVFGANFETEENSEKYDPIKKEFYRIIPSLTPCSGEDIRIFRSRYSKKQKKFIPIAGNSIKFPGNSKHMTAKPGLIPKISTVSHAPFRSSAISSWRGDHTSADYEPPTSHALSDYNKKTAWIGGNRGGKKTFFTFKRSYENYPIQGLSISPAHFRNKKSLQWFRGIKSFYIIDSKGISYKISIPGKSLGQIETYHVLFPKPLKGRCVTIILDNFFPLKKQKKGKTTNRPPAISEITLFSKIDFAQNPFDEFLDDFSKEKLSLSHAYSIIKTFDDSTILSKLKEKTTSPQIKKMLLLYATQSKDKRFLPYLVSALSFASGEFFKRVVYALVKLDGAILLKDIILDKKRPLEFRKKAFSTYLNITDPSMEMVLLFINSGDNKDKLWRHLVEKSVKRKKRHTLLKKLCNSQKASKQPGVLWLGAKWTQKDKYLAPLLFKCLKKKPGGSFVHRMRYLFAAQTTKNPKFIKIIKAIFKKDSRIAVKARAVEAAAHIKGGEELLTLASKSKIPTIRYAVVDNWDKNKPLPSNMVSELKSTWPDLRNSIFSIMSYQCDKRLLKPLDKIIRNPKDKLWAKSLLLISKCKFKKFTPTLIELMEKADSTTLKATYALGISRIGAKQIIPLIKKEILSMVKASKLLAAYDERNYAAAMFIRALGEYKMRAHDSFFISLIKKKAPRLIHQVVTDILSTRCPKEVLNNTFYTGDNYSSQRISLMKRICKKR
jgi:hypothetical protein